MFHADKITWNSNFTVQSKVLLEYVVYLFSMAVFILQQELNSCDRNHMACKV